MMVWTIVPGQGLGRLRFGMSPEEVAALPGMGRAGHVYRGRGNRIMEYRGLSVPVCEYSGGALCAIVAGRHVEAVVFDGIDLFAAGPREVLHGLEQRFGTAQLCQEQLVFAPAGLRLGGYYDAHDHRFFEPGVDYHDERFVTLCVPDQVVAPSEQREEVSLP
ncbi:hypothetical protein [Rhodovulum sp. P5]|uniref:hypothetical protein n=1 Tax=Rhodovulum sp. P5 TaxID=1564506 RepID=UPI0012EBFEC1|nr:hypothetical protein [Rhodovulum sp. P5]